MPVAMMPSVLEKQLLMVRVFKINERKYGNAIGAKNAPSFEKILENLLFKKMRDEREAADNIK